MADLPASTFMVSQRLWFRAPEEADAGLITAWRNKPQMRRAITTRFPMCEEAARKWIHERNPWIRGAANDHAVFMFGLKESAEPIGNAGVFAIDWPNRRCEYGVMVDEAHWNRGYGREATSRMVQYAFSELNLHRVELHVLASNAGGIKAYQAVGFVQEGVMRQTDFVDGLWEDVLVMSILRGEWQRPAES